MLVYAGASQLTDDRVDNEGDMLPVVAELSYDIEVLTVEQAVMRLELNGLGMLMFAMPAISNLMSCITR